MRAKVPSCLRPALKILAAGAGLWLAAQPILAQTVVWSGADVASHNTNWSDANNWTGGTPGPGTNIYFFDTGASGTQGAVNNIVNGNTTISSLDYGNTNGFHTTQINTTVTLTISNGAAATLVTAGTGTDDGASQTSYSTIKGPGTLSVLGVNSGSVFSVQQGSATTGSHLATLDMSGLANFNLFAGRLLVGGNGGSAGNVNRLSGTLYFANTSSVQVYGASPAVDVGDGTSDGGTEHVYLGQSTTIFADTMTIAREKSVATMSFNPAFGSSSTFDLFGNSASTVNTLAIGDFSAQSGSGSTVSGTVDLTGGTVHAEVNTCFVAEGQSGSGSGPTTGVLNIGAGLFDVNALLVGIANSSSAVGAVTGTVLVTNGTLAANEGILLGYNPGKTIVASGTLDISNGTVLTDIIIAGGGTSAVNLRGGLLVITNTMGTPSAPLSSLSVNGGATLQLFLTNNPAAIATAALSSDNSGVINISTLPTILAYPDQIPLIYCPGGGASGVTFALGPLPDSNEGYLTNDNSSMIWLVITNGPVLPQVDEWGGRFSDNWDTNTSNWAVDDVPVLYAQGESVLFTDGARFGTVVITGAAPYTPYSWTVTNDLKAYVFSGPNSVSGTCGLVKDGAGSLTLSEDNDDFSGGITVNGGTVILDEASSAISGGLVIASGATAQVGNNDAYGSLPAGTLVNNGNLAFSANFTNVLALDVPGSGSLTQNGSSTLELAGNNTYTGNTVVLQGTLVLLSSGSIASTNIIVSHGTLDVSQVGEEMAPCYLEMTNGTITVGAGTTPVAGLSLGGSSNTLNIVALPPLLVYPTNVTIIQSAGSIVGNNFVLARLPTNNPPYVGSITQNGNSVILSLASGPMAIVQATVSFSPGNAGLPLNPAFCGLSYEKSEMEGNLFVPGDTSMIKMLGQIAPAVLRIGGNSVNRTCWNGLSNSPPITAADVDAFAGFVKALPTNWSVIYGINMATNTPANCAAEAAYVANALGSRLLGFEIGNEPDLYHGNTIRPSGYSFSDFVAEWGTYAAAITNAVPGWAATNGGNGWTLTGPASASNTKGYTVPFAGDEVGKISLLTQHYYRGNGQSASSTIEFLLQPDTGLPGTIQNLVSAAGSANLPLGFRMDECGSYYNGGAPNVSDAYGTALWALDYMFTLAENGAQGMNFHGGGDGTGYTPIADNGSSVVQARPEFYGLKMFSLADQGGNVIPATITLSSNINFTAYGVRRSFGGISALLNNKDTNYGALVSVNLGTNIVAADVIELTGTNLSSTSGYTLGGAPINPDGSWAGGVQWVVPATNGQVTFLVPPISAVLLNPVIASTNLTWSLTGNQLSLSWPTNYIGWLLQSNPAGLGAGNEWFTVPGSSTTNRFQVTINRNMTNVFYRMVSPQ